MWDFMRKVWEDEANSSPTMYEWLKKNIHNKQLLFLNLSGKNQAENRVRKPTNDNMRVTYSNSVKQWLYIYYN